MPRSAVFLLLLLVSCTPTTLYTDDVFRGAAPEITAAWESLTPWHPARSEALASGVKAVQEALGPQGPPRAVVGMMLLPSERAELEAAYPRTRFLFIIAGAPVPGENTFSVRRADTWSAVARGAASPRPAAAAFPTDAKPEEIREFQDAWAASQGGPLATAVGFQPELLDNTPAQFFHWAAGEPDGRVLALSSVTLHGNPGMSRQPGTSGLTWKIRAQGLGDLLWAASQAAEKKAHFLPLETVLDGR